jgi:flagellin-like hook-associated protein FlgL
MLTEQEAQNQIKELEKELGVSPTTLTEADAQSEIEALQKEMASLPMTIKEFATKRKEDGEKAFSDKALAFGSTIAEGFKELGRQGMEATKEAEGLLDLDAYGDIINIGSRDFWRFAKTIGGSIMDELGHTNQEELVREYMRYRQNFDYYQKVRPAMLDSDEIEYKKLTDFGANFIDPFMAFPVAKIGTFATKTTLKGAQKGLTAGATLSRSQGMVNVAKGFRGAGRAIQNLERGVDIAGKIGAYPTEMASRMTAKALRKGAKGTALVAGYGLKGIGAIGSGTAKVASAPRKGIEAVVSKVSKKAKDLGGVTLGGQVVGGITGSVPGAMELGIAEGIGLIAKKIGKGAGEVLTTLAQPASNKRFLYRLATNSKVSPQTRKLAMHAYNFRGQLWVTQFSI